MARGMMDTVRTCAVVDLGTTEYSRACELQKSVVKARLERRIPDLLLFTEHNHVYTIGRSGTYAHLLADEQTLRQKGLAVFETDRGGDITYHGPGQLVGYPILDLREHYLDVHRYMRDLEEVLIRTVSDYGLNATRRPGLTGVWVDDAKIAALGVKISRWITFHGFALNVSTDLSFFKGIVPCGIQQCAVTSLALLCGSTPDLQEVARGIVGHFCEVFRLNALPMAPEGLYSSLPPPVSS